MELVNTDGLVLIGPGSEWLWAAISGIAVVVTFFAIYRQLRLQRSAGSMEQASLLWHEWLSEAMARHRVAILVAMRDGDDPTKIPPAAQRYVGSFWDRIGYAVRSGHMEARLVYETFYDVAIWWHWLAPACYALRRAVNDPGIGQHYEWLAQLIDTFERERGAAPLHSAALAQLIPTTIEFNLEAIRTFEETRAVVSRQPTDGAQRARPKTRTRQANAVTSARAPR
jgi:hypothetical protein